MIRKNLLFTFGVAALLLLLLAGHVAYWYLPRARPGIPQADGAAERLLASEDFPVVLWLPFPHQNLSFLQRDAGAEDASLEALTRLAGLPRPYLPSFGPLMVPPASEMAVASNEAGDRFVVLARVYPAFAAFARLAGRLADNPWLKGGDIYAEGRRVEVAWRGDLWMVASPELPRMEVGAQDRPAAAFPALALLQVRQATHPLPSGRYRLIRRGAALEIVAGTDEAAAAGSPDRGTRAFEELGLAELGIFLLVVSGRLEPLGEPAQALAFFSSRHGDAERGGTKPEDADRLDLPRVAVIHEPAGERWSLPGESILELAGREPRVAAVAGWSIAALDAAGLEGARALAPRLDVPEVFKEPRPEGRLVWGLWLDLDAGLREVSRIAGLLAEVPIVPRRQVERWRDAEAVLTPLAARYARLTLVVTEAPRALRLRLEPVGPG